MNQRVLTFVVNDESVRPDDHLQMNDNRKQEAGKLTVCPALLLRCSAATSRAFSVAPPLPSGSWRSCTVNTNAS